MDNVIMVIKQSSSGEAHFIAAERAAEILRSHGYEAYLVGGAVRDLLLGHLPKDFDLVTNSLPSEIQSIKEFSGSKYKDTAQAFGVTRVVLEVEYQGELVASHLEIATYRRDIEAHLGRKLTKVEFANIEDDVMRRDFTINALALDLEADFLIDLVGGLRDLEHKLVRFIGDPAARIQEDPLRLLRGLRFVHQLGFELEPETHTSIKAAVKTGAVTTIATDRISDELTQMLTAPARANALRDLASYGILAQILPEVAAGTDVDQPADYHGSADVFEHTVTALSYLPEQSSRRLVWATLMHDIGKPVTARPTSQTGDRIRFDSHAQIGAELAAKRLKELKFSNKVISDITWLIHYHMSVDDLPNMTPAHQHHYMSHPAFPDLLELHKADARAAWSQSHNGEDGAQQDLGFSELDSLYEGYLKELGGKPKPTIKSELGIDGQWVMQKFKVPPGEQLGQVLDSLNQAFFNKEITTQEQAQSLVARLLKP